MTIFKTKERAREVLVQSAKVLYVYAAVLMALGVYDLIRSGFSSLFFLTILAVMFAGPAFIAHRWGSRIAASIPVFITAIQLIGTAFEVTFSVPSLLSAAFILFLAVVSARLFLATVFLKRRDTIAA